VDLLLQRTDRSVAVTVLKKPPKVDIISVK
jgi:hypothetical protein